MNRKYDLSNDIGPYDENLIRKHSEGDFARLHELERLLDTPAGTGRDIVERSEIIAHHGFLRHAMGSLYANVVDPGDDVYRALRTMFGYAPECEFDEGVFSFLDEFGLQAVEASRQPLRGLLALDMLARADRVRDRSDDPLSRILYPECHITFDYWVGGVEADIYNSCGLVGEDEYIVLRRVDTSWTIIETKREA